MLSALRTSSVNNRKMNKYKAVDGIRTGKGTEILGDNFK
jgi:hypothetical protein